MYRVAFDPQKPVHAASSFFAAGVEILQDAEIDWRALDVTELTLYDWWRAGLVYHPLPAAEAQALVSASEPSKVAMYKVSPGESISVRTPEQQQAERLSRRERRALRNQG